VSRSVFVFYEEAIFFLFDIT